MKTKSYKSAFAALLVLIAILGCSQRSDTSSTTTTTAVETTHGLDRETWDVYVIQGARIGYGRTNVKHTTEKGCKIVRIEGLNHLAVKRFGEKTIQEIRFTSNETPDGKLIDFTSEIRQGPVPMLTTGRVVGQRLKLKTSTKGKTTDSSIPWQANYGGFYAVELSLAARPMTPGERRTVHALIVGLYQVAAVEMTAVDYEPVEMLTGTCRLLRIDTVTRFDTGMALRGAVWTDLAGETIKTFTNAMNIETFRTTKAVAMEDTNAAELDLGWDISVKLERPIERPHQSKKIRYKVHLDGGDPATVFVEGLSQAVRSLGPNTAEITVYAIRPDTPDGNPEAPDDPPTEADRRPNNLIQSDNPRILAEAKKVAGGQTDPWRVAVALEQYVNSEITEKNFTQAFATAADVAKTREGDCSEHAVFLAALARACGIPARVAVGLVYVEGTQSFCYHAWTEVYVAGRWIPLDATLAEGGIGAAHLKLGHSNLEGASAYSSFLPVIQVAGRLKIEPIEM